MVLLLGQGLIDAWLFGRAGDRVERQLSEQDAALAGSVLLVRTVRCDGSAGTGTAFTTRVGDRTVLLTNRHVVEGSATVGLRSLIDVPVPRVTAWRLSETADVAVLNVDDDADLGDGLPLASVDLPTPGTPVRTVGFPSALPFTTTGEIVEARDDRITARIRTEPGASGSPLLDASGDVVGQVFARTSDGRGVVTPVGALRSGLERLGRPITGC